MSIESMYMQIIDCPSKGEKHEWIHSTAKGDYDSWGNGIMKQARCTKCGVVRYLQFNDTPIQTIDGKMILDHKKLVEENGFGEQLIQSVKEALEHAQGKRTLKTTYRELKDESIQKKS